MKNCKKRSEKKTHEHFNEIAKEYNDSFDGRYVRPMYAYFLDFFSNIKENSSILDIGCGNGNVLKELINGKRELYGVDLSENMIKEAEKLLGENVSLHIADAKKLPFQKEKFDYIICNASFHHYPEPMETLREMKRVLKKGGTLLIGEGYAYEPFRSMLNLYFKVAKTGDIHTYGMRELTKMLQSAGFQLLNIKKYDTRIFFEAKVVECK